MTPWTVACQAPLPSTISLSLLKLMSIELVMLSVMPQFAMRQIQRSPPCSPSPYLLTPCTYSSTTMFSGAMRDPLGDAGHSNDSSLRHTAALTELSAACPPPRRQCLCYYFSHAPSPLPYHPLSLKTCPLWDSPADPVVKTLSFNAGGSGSIPGQGTKIPFATGHSQKKKNLSHYSPPSMDLL